MPTSALNPDSPQLIVVGGGAAGFFAAIRAKTQLPELNITILETAHQPLRKVKISGGGRCNVTHACFGLKDLIQHYPRNSRALKKIFSRFGPQDTMNWFEFHDVPLKIEPDGRVFPVSDKSQTIINALTRVAKELGIIIQTDTRLEDLQRNLSQFWLKTNRGVLMADSVLLTTGSSLPPLKLVEQLGHHPIPQVPSLFTFKIKDSRIDGLSGITFPWVKGKLMIPQQDPVPILEIMPQLNPNQIEQEGPLLITHWGVSGPVVLRLSAWGARLLHQADYQGQLVIDFFPTLSHDTLREALFKEKDQNPQKHIGNHFPWDLPKRFWEKLLRYEGLSSSTRWMEMSAKSMNRLAETVKHSVFEIQGKGEFKEEFVTAGGIPLTEIHLETMESRLIPRLYFAGEILDVDGLTGGFNFQNAWSTGWIAGDAIATTYKNLLSLSV